MQSAYDRNDYVLIHLDNIYPWQQGNFERHSRREVTHFNTTYDYGSIMHYRYMRISIKAYVTKKMSINSVLFSVRMRLVPMAK